MGGSDSIVGVMKTNAVNGFPLQQEGLCRHTCGHGVWGGEIFLDYLGVTEFNHIHPLMQSPWLGQRDAI